MPYGRATPVVLSEPERVELERLERRRNAPQGLALRARIVLRCAAGLTNQAVAAEIGACAHTVGRWRERFARDRLAGLSDEPRSGAPRRAGSGTRRSPRSWPAPSRRCRKAPPTGAGARWPGPPASPRPRSAGSGAPSGCGRTGARPSSSRPTPSSWRRCATRIVGLYLAPPDRALVLCVDEKTGVQALDRTQPLLPMRPGQAERRTHDYARHGTTSLFAALDVRAGTVIGRCMPRHRAPEFRRFLDEVEHNVPVGLDVHVVMDDAGIHKTGLIRDWFAKRPRWHVHFAPTSASWLNQVERFFALLTDKALRRGVHRSTAELEASIEAYIAATNAEPSPFRWTKSADEILATVQRFCARTLAIHEAQA